MRDPCERVPVVRALDLAAFLRPLTGCLQPGPRKIGEADGRIDQLRAWTRKATLRGVVVAVDVGAVVVAAAAIAGRILRARVRREIALPARRARARLAGVVEIGDAT